MEPRLLKKSELKSFLKKIKKKAELIAPIKTDILRFLPVDDVSKISLKGQALYSPKKYLYNSKLTLFKYGKNGISSVSSNKKIIIFGIRLCDINAFLRLDKLFLDDIGDEHYKNARENMTLIGINCEIIPHEMCFCESMELKDKGYDLFFCDVGKNFHIKVGSEKGEALVKNLPFSKAIPKPIKTEKKLLIKDISKLYEHPAWKEETERCISCGACTNLCPDCLCFDVYDKLNIDLKSGERKNEWDSCQYKDFTKVAGSHVFRDTRESRLKHRIWHKLQYFKEKFDEYMCTGCGRCIYGCPTKIDFVEVINKNG